MKKILLVCALFGFAFASCGQKSSYDIATFTPPKKWKKDQSESGIQFSTEDSLKGSYCLITLLKSVPGTPNSKENFEMAWESIIKEMVSVSTAPEMVEPSSEKGWDIESGYAPFEADGNKGIAMLVTASGFEKMVNVIILTNTDEYEQQITSFLESLDLKATGTKAEVNKPVATKPVTTKTTGPVQTQPPVKGGFTFTTTNFDDGWVSIVREDWVEVKKGTTTVLIHYPNSKIDPPVKDLENICAAAWNVLVAPRYRDMTNYKVTPSVLDYLRPYYVQANLVDNETGANVFVALFKRDESGWIEIITPSKSSFVQEFGLDIDKIDYYADSKIWEPLQRLATYNRFAVAEADLTGKWTNNFSGMQQYVNIYTGASAGMSTHSSYEEFVFLQGKKYNWELKVASGFVGNMNFVGVKSSGKLTVPNNWQINFSDIEKKPKSYSAYFSCIKGARILWLKDIGYGSFTGYGKAN